MKPKPGEIGNFNPYTGEYESVLSSEERSAGFNNEDVNEEIEIKIDPTELKEGEMLPADQQPETWDPVSMSWKKAGSK